MLKLMRHGTPNIIQVLSDLRTRVLRKGIWYQSLTNQERVLVGLISKNIKIVKNAMLATVIARLMGKLISAIKNSFFDMIVRLGRPIAESSATAALMMGWNTASEWVEDIDIVKWFGFTAYYGKCE